MLKKTQVTSILHCYPRLFLHSNCKSLKSGHLSFHFSASAILKLLNLVKHPRTGITVSTLGTAIVIVIIYFDMIILRWRVTTILVIQFSVQVNTFVSHFHEKWRFKDKWDVRSRTGVVLYTLVNHLWNVYTH